MIDAEDKIRRKFGPALANLRAVSTPAAFEYQEGGLTVEALLLGHHLYLVAEDTLYVDLDAAVADDLVTAGYIVRLYSVCEEPLVKEYAEYFLENYRALAQEQADREHWLAVAEQLAAEIRAEFP